MALQRIKIQEFHSLKGEVITSEELEKWLERKLREVVVEGRRFEVPKVGYRYEGVYKEITRIERGKTETYSEVARRGGVKFAELLSALMRNPLQILIPCHRLVAKKSSLMGFYPLGVKVKRKLLEIEGSLR